MNTQKRIMASWSLLHVRYMSYMYYELRMQCFIVGQAEEPQFLLSVA